MHINEQSHIKYLQTDQEHTKEKQKQTKRGYFFFKVMRITKWDLFQESKCGSI